MTQSGLLNQYGTIHQFHKAIRSKEFSVTELIKKFIERARPNSLGAFITLCEDRALKQAQEIDVILSQEGEKAFERFPLIGVPLGIKDLITVDGVRTTAGSKILENYIPPYSATVIQRLEAAGAITLGKLNLDEFGMGSSNENSAYGMVQHPTHSGYVPGGSSGGSAAAVKAGYCIGALGTDTGGSIRLPASYCGVVGLKPTYGRVSRFGQIAFASSLDQIGPMTHSVEDAALILDVMSGHDPLDSTSFSRPATQAFKMTQKSMEWSGIKIGIPKEYFIDGISPDVESAIQDSLKWFKKQGAQIVEVSLPHTSYAVSVYYIVAVSEASSNLARFDGVRFGVRPLEASQGKDLAEFYMKVRSNFGPEVKRRILLGTFALSSGYSEAYYKRACQVRRKIKNDFDEAFKKVDFIMGPVSPTAAFKTGEKSNDPLQMYLNDIFTIPASLAGLPAMSLPCGYGQNGLPIGLHCIAPAFGEDQLIAMTHAFSTSYDALRMDS